jgi:hypothetical protein
MGWEAVRFAHQNATNLDLETIPADLQGWISEDRDLEATMKSRKWIDLKLLMETKS